MYLFQVKSPAESKNDWDFYKLVSTIRPTKRSGRCAREVVRSSQIKNENAW
jgi:hypothetical protein